MDKYIEKVFREEVAKYLSTVGGAIRYKNLGDSKTYELEYNYDKIQIKDLYSALLFLMNEYYDKEYAYRGNTDINEIEFAKEKYSNGEYKKNEIHKMTEYQLIKRHCIEFILFICKEKLGIDIYHDIDQDEYSSEYNIENLENDITEYVDSQHKVNFQAGRDEEIDSNWDQESKRLGENLTLALDLGLIITAVIIKFNNTLVLVGLLIILLLKVISYQAFNMRLKQALDTFKIFRMLENISNDYSEYKLGYYETKPILKNIKKIGNYEIIFQIIFYILFIIILFT